MLALHVSLCVGRRIVASLMIGDTTVMMCGPGSSLEPVLSLEEHGRRATDVGLLLLLLVDSPSLQQHPGLLFSVLYPPLQDVPPTGRKELET